MKLIDLVENYKGTVTFNVKDVNDEGDAISISSFTNENYAAIKDNILNSEVAKYTVGVVNTVPAKITIDVTIKEIAPDKIPDETAGEGEQEDDSEGENE